MKRGLTSLFLLLPGLLLGQPLVTAQVEQQPGSQVIGLAGTPSESAILSLSGMSYWVAGQETDSQNLTQLGSSGAGDAQFGSTSGADSNDPTALPWYSTSDYDVTVDGVNYKYLSDNLVTNGDFENWTGGAPNGWTETEAGSTTLNQETSDVASGSSALRMDIDGSNNAGQIVQNGIFKANTLYYYSLSAKCEAGGSYAQLRIGSDADVLILTTSYQTFTGFQYSGATTGLDIRRNGTASNLSIYFDNVVVREVTANLGDHVYLPGTSGNYLSHPDSAAVSVTGDITIQVECALDDWVPSGQNALLTKWLTTGNQRSYGLFVYTDGRIGILHDPVGSGGTSVYSSTAPTLTNGQKYFIRGTVDVDNGSSNSDFKFYISSDGETFSQVGTTVNGGGVVSFFDGSSPVTIGCFNPGTNWLATGSFYSARIWDSDIGSTATSSAPTPVMNWRASSMTQSGGADEESGSSWTINRSASGLKSTLVTRPVIVFDSAASTYLQVADHDDLDMGATDDFTVWVYGREHGTQTTNGRYIDKRGASGDGYVLYNSSGPLFFLQDTSTKSTTSIASINGSVILLRGLRSSDTMTVSNGTTNASNTGVSGWDVSNTDPLLIGGQGATNNDLELFAAGVLKGTALTATQLASLKTELDTLLQGRTGDDALLLFLFILLPIFRKPKNNVVEFEPDEEWRDAA